jgi:hypothetical protein
MFWLFCVLVYYNMQNIVKILLENDMVEVQTWAPWKMMQLHYPLEVMCFHVYNNFFSP